MQILIMILAKPPTHMYVKYKDPTIQVQNTPELLCMYGS